MNKKWLPLALILLLALTLRLVNLEGRPLWYDEAFSVLFAEKGLDNMLYGTLEPVAGGTADIHPLLYYTTLNVWMEIFGQSPFAVRFWSVAHGVATVALIYLLTRRLFDESVGRLAALISALAPFHVQYSQETRMYALLGLLLIGVVYCFVRGWQTKNDWKWWIVFGILAGLAMYTQQLAAFFLVALALVPVFTRRIDLIGRVFVGGVIAIIVYLPWLVNLPGQLNKVNSYYWLRAPNFARPLLTLRSFLVVNLDFPSPASMLGLAGAFFVVIMLILQLVIRLRRRIKRADQNSLLLILWLAAGPPVLMWAVSQIQPVYLERALLPSALMLYIVLAWFFLRSGLPRPIAGLIGIVGLGLVGIGLYYQYTWDTFPNSPFQAGSAVIHDQWQDGDVVVHQNKLTALPMVYYGRNLEQRYIGDVPGSPQDTLALPTQEALQFLAHETVQSAVFGSSRVWWVTFDFAEEQYAAADRPEFREAQDWLEANNELVEVHRFGDLEITLFSNPTLSKNEIVFYGFNP